MTGPEYPAVTMGSGERIMRAAGSEGAPAPIAYIASTRMTDPPAWPER